MPLVDCVICKEPVPVEEMKRILDGEGAPYWVCIDCWRQTEGYEKKESDK